MKKLFTSIFILATFFCLSQAPTFQWAKSCGNSNNEIGRSIGTDASGNVYTCGTFYGTVDFDPGAGIFPLVSSGQVDVFIQKLDPNGNFIWAKRLGSTGFEYFYSAEVDGAGNIYLAGSNTNIIDLDPGPGTFTYSASGNTDIFIVKLDALGNFVWGKKIGGANTEEAYGIAINSASEVFLTGTFELTLDFDPGVGVTNLTSVGLTDIYVLKLDASGNFLWVKQLGSGNSERSYSIKTDVSGNVYTTGLVQGTIDFDPGPGTYTVAGVSGADGYIQKLDGNGNFVWARRIGGVGADVGNDIDVDASGNVVIVGHFAGALDFDPGPGTFTLTPPSGFIHGYTLLLDALGNFVWVKSIGPSNWDASSTSVSFDLAGNVYTSGYFYSTIDLDPGPGIVNATSAGVKDIFIQKLSASGNYSWGSSIGATSDDEPFSSRIDLSNNFYSTGSFGSIVDFDPTAGSSFLSSSALSDMFNYKLGFCLSPPAPTNITASSNQTLCTGNSTTLQISGGATLNWYSSLSSTVSIGSGTTFVTPILTSGAAQTIYSYYAAETNTCSEGARTVITLTVYGTPTIAVNSGSICIGQSFTMIPSGASSYTFQGGSSIVNPTITSSYTVSGTSTAGCLSASSATSNITVNSLPTITVNSGTICSGQTFTIIPSGATTYTYQGGSAVVSPTTTSSYTVSGTSSVGCISANSVTCNVTVNATPTINVNSGSICSGNSFTMVPAGANTYTFQGGNAVVSPTATTSYTIFGTSFAGCVSTLAATSNVTVNPTPTVTIIGSMSVCPFGITSLTVSGASTYTWNPGGAFSSVISATPGVWTASATASNGCKSVGTVTIGTFATPTVSATGLTNICSGASTTLTAIGALSYTWTAGPTTASYVVTPTTTTSYFLSGVDANGCNDTAIINVNVNPLPTITANTSNSIICGPPGQQTATLTASGANTYTWNPGGIGISIAISPSITSTYTVTGTDANGCSNSSTFTQSVSTCAGIVSNAAFTLSGVEVYPNPTNSILTIELNTINENSCIEIYNTIGQLIFKEKIIESKQTLNLSHLNVGVYFVKVQSESEFVIKKIIKQ